MNFSQSTLQNKIIKDKKGIYLIINGVNSPRRQQFSVCICLKQNIKIHLANTDRTEEKKRQTHNYRDFNTPILVTDRSNMQKTSRDSLYLNTTTDYFIYSHSYNTPFNKSRIWNLLKLTWIIHQDMSPIYLVLAIKHTLTYLK